MKWGIVLLNIFGTLMPEAHAYLIPKKTQLEFLPFIVIKF